MNRSLMKLIVNVLCIFLIQVFQSHSSFGNSCIEDLSIRPKTGKIQLMWSFSPDTEKYEILRGLSLNGPFHKIAETQSSYSTYLDVDIDPDVLYYYQIERIADNGNDSCVSNVIAGLAPGERTRLTFAPNVINEPQATAINLIGTASLTIGNIDQVSSTNISAGNVAIQDPPPNSAVPTNFPIDLVVSEGANPNNPPVANAGDDQTVFPGDTAFLDGSGSFDLDGDPLTFHWILNPPQGSAAILSDSTGVMPTFEVDVFGDYFVQLIVNDGSADSNPDTTTISTENSPPVADAGGNLTALGGDTVILDGSGSFDVDSDPLSFHWSLSPPPGSKAVLSDPTAEMPTFEVDVLDDYLVQLIVNDGNVDSDPDTATVSTENSPPVAHAGDDFKVLVGDTATLDGSRSSDVDGDPLTFQWSLISVPAGSTTTLSNTTTVSPTVIADVPGLYLAQLIVNDGTFDSVPDTVMITAEITEAQADLWIGITDDADPIVAGATISYTVAVNNQGPADAENVVVTDSLPAGVTFVSTTGCAEDPTGVSTCSLGNIPAGDSVKFIVTVSLDAGTTGTLINSATVTSDTEDPNDINNMTTEDTSVITLPEVKLEVTDAHASEIGPELAIFTFIRTQPTTTPLTVFYTTSGSATNGLDYETLSGNVTIPVGSTNADVTISPIEDPDIEGPEEVQLTLNTSPAYTVKSPDTASATIADNQVLVTIKATDPEASEENLDPGEFTLKREGGDLTSPLTVVLSHGGTAINGADYITLGGPTITATIPENQASTTVTITPIKDTLVEGNETVVLTIEPSSEYAIGLPQRDTVVIAASSISIREPANNFGKLGAGLQATYRIVLGASGHGGVKVRISSSNPGLAKVAVDSSTMGTDFIDLDIPDGEITADFVVQSVSPSATGSVDLTAIAPAFTDGSITLPLVTPVLSIHDLPDTTTALTGVIPFRIRTGIPNASGTGIFVQNVSMVAGDLSLTVSSSDPGIGQVVTTSPSGASANVILEAGQLQTASSVATGGVGLDPFDVGTTTVSAMAAGFDPDFETASQAITVSELSSIAVREASTNLAKLGAGLQNTYRVVLGASEHGGVTVRITSSDPSLAVVALDGNTVGSEFIDIDILDGETIADFVVQGVDPTSTGSIDLTASAPGFIDGSLSVPLVVPVLGFNELVTETTVVSANEPFRIRTGVPNASGTEIFIQNVSMAAGDLTLTVSSGTPTVGQLEISSMDAPSVPVVISGGQFQTASTVATGGVALDPIDVGNTKIMATAPGFASGFPASSQVVTITSVSTISMREAFTNFGKLGAGMQLSYRVILGASEHGGVTVRITSNDPNLAVVALDGNTVGSEFIDIDILDGETIADFVVQGVDPSVIGTIDLIASAPGFIDGALSVPLEVPVLGFHELVTETSVVSANESFRVRTGIPNASGTGIFIQNVSMATGDLTLTVNSSTPAVGQLETTSIDGSIVPVVVAAGQFQTASTVASGGVAFDPLDMGTTTVAAAAPGFDPNFPASSQDVTVSALSSITVREVSSNIGKVGAGLQHTYRLVLGASEHGGVTVRITSSDPNLAVVALEGNTVGSEFIDIDLLDGETIADFVVQGVNPAATGTVNLTANAPGFIDGSLTVPLVAPVLSLNALVTETTVVSADEPFRVRTGVANVTGAGIFTQSVSMAAGDLTLTVSSDTPAVGQLVTNSSSGAAVTIDVAAGQFQSPTTVAAGGVAFDPIDTETTTVAASAAGYDDSFALATQEVTVEAMSTISMREAFSNLGQLAAGMQQTYRVVLGASEHGGVTVRIGVSNPSLAKVTADGSLIGTDFIDVDIPNGQTIANFVVQSVSPTATGTLDLTASALSFTDGSLKLPLVPPVLAFNGLKNTISTLSPDDPFVIRTGIANPFGTGIIDLAVSMVAGDLTVTLNSSIPTIGQPVTDVTNGATVTVVVAAGQSRSPATVTTGGIAFDPLAAGITRMTATAAGFDESFSLSSQEVTVNP